MRRGIGAIATVALGAATFASPAAATTILVIPDDRFGDQYIVQGDKGANDIRLTEQGNRYLISDSRSRIEDPDDLCAELSPRRVRCDIPYIDVVAGAGGRDRLKIVGREKDIFDLEGGGGRDVLIGGLSRDTLRGDRGGDVMRGRKGKDLLGFRFGGGDRGKDVFVGGSGQDFIGAKDRRRDRVINCGPGKRERAKIDRGKDPDPIGCERVKRVG